MHGNFQNRPNRAGGEASGRIAPMKGAMTITEEMKRPVNKAVEASARAMTSEMKADAPVTEKEAPGVSKATEANGVQAGDKATTSGGQKSNKVFGVVAGCKMLNIRKLPAADAAIVAIIPADSEVMVDDSAMEAVPKLPFYKICTASGIEGFCMKRYIRIRP